VATLALTISALASSLENNAAGEDNSPAPIGIPISVLHPQLVSTPGFNQDIRLLDHYPGRFCMLICRCHPQAENMTAGQG